MPVKITYYAIVDTSSSEAKPGGVLRRIQDDAGSEDQSFTRDLTWESSTLLHDYEHGNRDSKLYEIGEIEAYQIVARIRHKASKYPPKNKDQPA